MLLYMPSAHPSFRHHGSPPHRRKHLSQCKLQYLLCLPGAMGTALADKAELTPLKLAQAATRCRSSCQCSGHRCLFAASSLSYSCTFCPKATESFSIMIPPFTQPKMLLSVSRRPPSPNRPKKQLSRLLPLSSVCFFHYNFGGNTSKRQLPGTWQIGNWFPPSSRPRITVADRGLSCLPQGQPHPHLLPGQHWGSGQLITLQLTSFSGPAIINTSGRGGHFR